MENAHAARQDVTADGLPHYGSRPARTSHRAMQAAIVWLTAGVIVVAGVLTALTLAYLRTQAIERGEQRSASFTQIVAEQTARTIQNVDQRLELAAVKLGRLAEEGKLDQASARQLLRAEIRSLPYVRASWTLDTRGRIEYDSDEGNIGVDLSDRDYYQVYARKPGTGFYLGDPVISRTVGTWLISAARPLHDREGKFAGVLVAAIEPSYFETVWAGATSEQGSSIALMRRDDGVLLVRSPADDAYMGKSSAALPLFTRYLPASPHGSFTTESAIDNVTRFFAYQTLDTDPPLVVLAGHSRQVLLAPWQGVATAAVSVWAASSLVLALLCGFLLRTSRSRIRAQDRADAVERRLALASRVAGIVEWEWSQDEPFCRMSPNHYASLGYPAGDEKVSVDALRAMVHPDDLDACQAAWDRMRRGEADDCDAEVRLRRADGDYQWVHVIGHVVQRDDGGRPARLQGLRIDVTRRKRAEIERQQVFERITDAFVALDTEWRYTFANARAGEMLGRDPASLIGKHIWTEFPEGRGQKFHLLYEKAMATQEYIAAEEYYPPYQRWFENHIYPSPDGLSIYFQDITERKMSELAVRDSEEKLRQLTENMHEVFWLMDAQTRRIEYVSPNYASVFGHPCEELLADVTSWRKVVHPQDLPVVLQAVEAQRATGGYDIEYRIVRDDGTVRWVHERSTPVRGENGDIARFSGLASDVTVRRTTETALRASEAQYRKLIDTLPSAMMVHVDGRLVMVNPAALRLFGATQESDLLGKPILELVHPAERDASVRRRRMVERGEPVAYPIELHCLRLDGSSFHVETTVCNVDYGGRQAMQSLLVDISERVRAQGALRESEERFRLAFNSSAVGLGLTRLDGRWLQVNQALCAITGYSQEDMLGSDFQSITHPDDLQQDLALVGQLLDGTIGHFQMEKRYIHARGHAVWIHLTVALVRDAAGAPLYTIAQVEDISARRRLEQDLRASQARLAAMFDAMPDLLFEVGIDGTIHDYHSPRTELLLFAPSEFLGKRVAEVMPRKAADVVHRALREADRTGHSIGLQYALELPGGERWFELSVARKAPLAQEGTRLICLARDVTERMQSEEALRLSEERFREMAESVREAFWLADIASGRMLYVSPAIESILGVPAQSMLDDPTGWRSRLHPDDRAQVLARLDAAHEGEGYDLEYRLTEPGGATRWVHSRAFPIRNADGQVYRVAGVLDDITARKRLQLQEVVEREVMEFFSTERALPELMARFVLAYEELLPPSRGSVLLMDPDGVHIRHGAAPRLPAAYVEAIDGAAIGPDTGSCGTAAHLGETVMVADIQSDPRWRDYRELAARHGLRACWSVPIKNSQGGVLGTFAFYFDTPRTARPEELDMLERGARLASTAIERRQAVHGLRQSEARYRSLVEWSPLGIGVHQGGVLVYVNPACVAIFGARSADELLGKRVLDLMVAEERPLAQARIDRILAGENTSLVLRRYVRLDGNVIEVEGKGAPITINGAPAVQFTMRDVTAENAAQRALRDSQTELRVLSARILAVQETERRRIAHELHDELGQALTAVKINLLAHQRFGSQPRAPLEDENIRIVEAALQQVRHLALALRPSMLDDLGLVPALRWLCDQTASRSDLHVAFEPDIPLDRLDPNLETACFRIVQEALTNVSRHAGATEVRIRLASDDDMLVLDVRDDGCGFDVDKMRQRAMLGGSLGVLGMQERATLIDGTLEIRSEPGKGSHLVLRCPWRVRDAQR